jgi:NAD(P)-dependent dehydrogenase (short-subunit alcohol dehydrogenase family)
MDVRGKGAVITGASRGLGAALAMELAKRGARVVAVARGAEMLTQVVQGIRAAGGEAHALAADLANKDDIHRVSGAAAALVGEVDLLIHYGGALGPTPLPLLVDAACEDLEAVLTTNVVGPFRLGKALIGPMLLRDRGLVVHISSDAASEPYPGWGLYSATKAAFDQLARVWAAELAGTGVRLFGVDPGEMETAMHAAAVPNADRASLARPAEVARTIAGMIADETISSGARVVASAWRAAR